MLSKRILVVDDDPSILRLVAAIFRQEGLRVDVAGGGREALAKLDLNRYDVIVLDLMMPEVSGLDVLRSLQTQTGATPIKCVIIMSAASPSEMADAVNPNVFATLSKPFDYPRLLASVRGCIEAGCSPETGVALRPATTAA